MIGQGRKVREMRQTKNKPELLAVIRLRGTINVHYNVRETLKNLNVRRSNYMTLVPNTSSYMGMLKKAKDYLTWGEVSQEALEYVLTKRGELPGRTKISNKYLKENSAYTTIKALSKALVNGETSLGEITGLKKFFRLHPASKGYKSMKLGFAEGGDLGYRGNTINELIVRMS